jgi:ABC-2 type transport system permease protein
MRTTLTILRRELRANFDSPVAYVVLCLTMVALGGWLFKGSEWVGQPNFWQANRASFETLFRWMPSGLAFLVVPVLTMRVMSEEKRSGTLEMLITLPVKDHEVILGKFFGTWIVVLMLIGSTLLYPLLMFKAPFIVHLLFSLVFGGFVAALMWPSDGNRTIGAVIFAVAAGIILVLLRFVGSWDLGVLDWGPIEAGYLGLVIYSAAITAFGLLISSLVESQIIAFFITWFSLAFLHAIAVFGGTWENETFRNILNYISFDTRLQPFSRGLISTRDVLYFASIAIICLMGSFRALERRKWA